MSVSNSPSGFDAKRYQHPQQNWVCGRLAEGCPCPLGPSTRGECLSENTCQPRRSLRSRRNFVTGLVFAASLGVCLLILGGSSENSSTKLFETTNIISPGPLSSPHSAIQEGCKACHSASSLSPVSMIGEIWNSDHAQHQSELCLNCHRDFGDHSLQAHSAAPELLELLQNLNTLEPQLTSDQQWARTLTDHRVAHAKVLNCATCHREHQGAQFDLTHLTNQQCQSCHENTFHSLSDGHPEFETTRERIRFDHSSHFEQHYKNYHFLMPGGIPKQSCNDCHLLSADGATYHLAGFEAMCASCHESQILDFNMPTALRLHQFEFVKQTPKTESPSTEPLSLPPFLELMLRADEKIANAIEALQTIPQTDTELRTPLLNSIEEATSQLLKDLQEQGAAGVTERLSRVTQNSNNDKQIVSVVKALDQSRFFEVLSTNDEEATIGSWTFLNNRATVVYRPQQHADPLIKAWLDFMASEVDHYPDQAEGTTPSRFDQFFRDAISPEASGRCTKCHTVDRLLDGSMKINWGLLPAEYFYRQFSKFVHRPHLTLMQDQTALSEAAQEDVCLKCHQPETPKPFFNRDAFLLTDGMPRAEFRHSSSTGYLPIQKKDCVQCHQPKMAGDNCLQCHDYHVHKNSILRR